MIIDDEQIAKDILMLESFLHDHNTGEYEWNEIVNVFGPNELKRLVDTIKTKDAEIAELKEQIDHI